MQNVNVVVSPSKGLIKEDWIAQAKSSLLFLFPVLLIIVPDLLKMIPADYKYHGIAVGSVAVYVASQVWGLLLRWYKTNYHPQA